MKAPTSLTICGNCARNATVVEGGVGSNRTLFDNTDELVHFQIQEEFKSKI